MTLILQLALTVAYIPAAWLALRHFMHIFQLNSYKPKVQLKWLKTGAKGFIILHLAAVIVLTASRLIASPLSGGLTSSITTISAITAAAGVAFLVFSSISNRPKSAKIPLKYTARIKRLIATLTVIYLIPVVLNILPLGLLDMPVLAALYIMAVTLSPFAVLLANLINRPIELSINKWYINDAKRILRECPNLTVIGITGSFGKTSVKYFLDELLSVKYNVLKTPGNFNTPLGVVKTIRGELRATHDIFLCEMGAKNVGDIKEICDIVHPKHGIITSVGPMHLESFGSLDNVKKTKFELADALPADGELWLNMDDQNVRNCSRGRQFIAYGIDSREGYYIENLSVTSSGSEFDVVSPSGERCRYKTKLIGRHNAINICGAIAAANSLGIPLDDLRFAVRRLESVPHRLELKQSRGAAIIDDAYNSNPSGAKAALEALNMMDGYKILVTPGMIELGDKQYELNREFGRQAAEVCDFVATVGKTNSDAISAGLKDAGYDEGKILNAVDLNSAMAKVYSLTTGEKKKIILLENDLPDNY